MSNFLLMVKTYVRDKEEKIFDTMGIQSVKSSWQTCIQNLNPHWNLFRKQAHKHACR